MYNAKGDVALTNEKRMIFMALCKMNVLHFSTSSGRFLACSQVLGIFQPRVLIKKGSYKIQRVYCTKLYIYVINRKATSLFFRVKAIRSETPYI